MSFNQEQKKSILEYGYPDAIDLYLPHMTIIRLKDEKIAKDIAKEIKWSNEEFKASSIVCYLMGKDGTCKQIIKEFKLI
jgi:2'-5' RNA ligase